jgi:hypothetical protein
MMQKYLPVSEHTKTEAGTGAGAVRREKCYCFALLEPHCSKPGGNRAKVARNIHWQGLYIMSTGGKHALGATNLYT